MATRKPTGKAKHRLATYVHVDVGGGEVKVFGPNDEIPAEVAELITNPKAWAAGEADEESTDPEPQEA